VWDWIDDVLVTGIYYSDFPASVMPPTPSLSHRVRTALCAQCPEWPRHAHGRRSLLQSRNETCVCARARARARYACMFMRVRACVLACCVCLCACVLVRASARKRYVRAYMRVCLCVCVRTRVRVRACAQALRACVHACVC
jgi:hypothetical protein